ncbi:MAG: GNAT family N-acetyltransferase [Capsulimonas sp.]|uniref:GNAT family N-acetyltransferase n=1 Tax=Capsulimonas sp. TaxID=2494211 RepID=UPI0032633A42
MPLKPRTTIGKPTAWQVRAPFPNEAEQVLHILCDAFHLRVDAARPIFANDPFFDLSHKRVLTTKAHGLVACLTIVPARVRVGSAWIPFGGIAGVATLPERQRQGYAGELLQGALRSLAGELHYPLSGLFTDLPNYYRRFGWEYATRNCVLKSPLAALPKYGGADYVRIAAMHDAPAQKQIASVHAATLSARPSGAFERDKRRWDVIRRFLPGVKIALYQHDGPATGYAIFEETPNELRVHEFHGCDQVAERALIGFLATRGARRLEWAAPLSEIQRLGLQEYACGTEPLSIEVQPDMMVRVADVAAALAAAHSANFAPVLNASQQTLTVIVNDDPICPDNRNPIRITSQGLEPGSQDDALWISLGIAAFGRLFLGYHDASTIQALGLLTASQPEALATADRLFPARDPFVAMPDRF